MDEVKDINALTQAALEGAPRRATRATRQWYAMAKAEAEPEVADINVYDAIGGYLDGVTAKQFVDDLAALPPSVGEIRLHVNSPGGDVFDALAIANALRAHPAKVVATIEGLAASAATIITQGGSDEVQVADNAVVMVHNPYGFAMGTAKEMRDTAAALDRAQDAIVASYQRKSPLSREELVALMDATTWMNADEAIANGFADAKVEGLRAAASIDPRALADLPVPEAYVERVAALVRPRAEAAPAPAPAVDADALAELEHKALHEDPPYGEYKVAMLDAAAAKVAAVPAAPAPAPALVAPAAASAEVILAVCREAGLDLNFAGTLLDAGTTEADARQLALAEKERRVAEAARQEEIRAACKLAGAAYLADSYIAGGMPAALVKQQLVAVTAQVDESRAGIDTALGTAAVAGRNKPVIDVVAIYAERNARR